MPMSPSAQRLAKLSVNFAFLAGHEPRLLETAAAAEKLVFADPVAALGRLRLVLRKFKQVPFPVPPLAEQEEITRQLSELIKWSESVEIDVRRALERGESLNQSILAKAFRGELVPQDPNDEPASVLLERIRAERATAEPVKKTRHRKKKAAKAKPEPKAEPKLEPKPEPAPKPEPGVPAPLAQNTQLDLLRPGPGPAKPQPVFVDEAALVMALLRAQLRGRGAMAREDILRVLARDLDYQRISLQLRKRLDGHLRAAVRRQVLERGGGEEVRLGCVRVEGYARDELIAALRSVSRRGCIYEREVLGRAVLAHLGFRRLTARAKEALRSAFNAAVRRGVFERVDATQVRRLAD